MMASCCPDVRRAVDAGTDTSGITTARSRPGRVISVTLACQNGYFQNHSYYCEEDNIMFSLCVMSGSVET